VFLARIIRLGEQFQRGFFFSPFLKANPGPPPLKKSLPSGGLAGKKFLPFPTRFFFFYAFLFFFFFFFCGGFFLFFLLAGGFLVPPPPPLKNGFVCFFVQALRGAAPPRTGFKNRPRIGSFFLFFWVYPGETTQTAPSKQKSGCFFFFAPACPRNARPGGETVKNIFFTWGLFFWPFVTPPRNFFFGKKSLGGCPPPPPAPVWGGTGPMQKRGFWPPPPLFFFFSANLLRIFCFLFVWDIDLCPPLKKLGPPPCGGGRET